MKVSFECSELIKELKKDIAEFGNDLKLYVITEQVAGENIYKDYDFEEPETNAGERTERIKASDLLAIYEKQNRVI